MVRTHPDPPNVRDNRRMAALSHRLHTNAYAARCSALPCLVLANIYGDQRGGISSAGRAPALQAGGRRFDPVILHQATSIEVAWRDMKRNEYGEAEGFFVVITPYE